MARSSPFRNKHAEAEASFLTWGPPDEGVEMVETFGEIASEYASLRKGCALFDMTNRGTVEVRGSDRIAFLNRMITQEVKDLPPHRVARSFWLNRKGRIDADLRVLVLGDRVLLDVDFLAASRAATTLDAFVIADDVQIADASDRWQRFSIHGPTALDLLGAVATHKAGAPLTDFTPGAAASVTIASVDLLVDRQDDCGETGLHLWVPTEHAERVWTHLIEAGCPHDENGGENGHNGASNGSLASRVRLRPSGWHAFNIARIEAGTPLYNIDFGPESLPGETGVLRDRVHFKKGCYLGQEVVARMDALGKPKQILVALRFDPSPEGEVVQPLSGGHVMAVTEDSAETVGVITSSTIAPMLGGTAVAFAQVRTKWAENPAASFEVAAEGARVRARLQPGLRFWSRDGA